MCLIKKIVKKFKNCNKKYNYKIKRYNNYIFNIKIIMKNKYIFIL